MSNMDRFTIHSQLQHLQSKYPGTGNADTTRLDWGINIQRDTLASHVGHYSRLAYFAVAENESIRRIRYRCLNQMVCPTLRADSTEEEKAAPSGEAAKDAAAEAEATKEAAAATAAAKETEEEEKAEVKEEKDQDADMAMEEGDDL
ncbi:splicing factor 3b subunit 10, putative [Eimeria tenella]|uniref:Splicing factor 3b subunit 10, putative n=1 Tax=Eimeria tenella TaxID=5802 RepID=U6KK81_EIMTE|nr:splicing factor 3b subunit 10, putative [Eimeria tenella]CDJ37236.1 splicing factor 3b subunit 10, putative [Eimeria tenella]|eukprot:XP_013228074.1 splicing factor 3b subunit 10, putative [Eimeria tenella]